MNHKKMKTPRIKQKKYSQILIIILKKNRKSGFNKFLTNKTMNYNKFKKFLNHHIIKKTKYKMPKTPKYFLHKSNNFQIGPKDRVSNYK